MAGLSGRQGEREVSLSFWKGRGMSRLIRVQPHFTSQPKKPEKDGQETEIGQGERLLEGETQTLSHCSWLQAEDMANRHCLSSLWGVRSYRNI